MRNPCRRCFLHGSGRAGWWKTLFTMFPKGPVAKKKLPYCADDFRAADTLDKCNRKHKTAFARARRLHLWTVLIWDKGFGSLGHQLGCLFADGGLQVPSIEKATESWKTNALVRLVNPILLSLETFGDSMAVATQTSTLMLHAKCCIFLFELKSWNMPQFAPYPRAVALEIGTLSKHLKHIESHKWHGIMLCACPGQGVRCAVCLQQATKIFHKHFWKLQCRDSSVKTPLQCSEAIVSSTVGFAAKHRTSDYFVHSKFTCPAWKPLHPQQVWDNNLQCSWNVLRTKHWTNEKSLRETYLLSIETFAFASKFSARYFRLCRVRIISALRRALRLTWLQICNRRQGILYVNLLPASPFCDPLFQAYNPTIYVVQNCPSPRLYVQLASQHRLVVRCLN